MDFNQDNDLPSADGLNMGSPSAGKTSALEQNSMVPAGWKPTVEKPLPVTRCTGTVRSGPREGQRCGRWSIAGASVCMVHGGHLPNVKEAAQKRVESAKMRLIADADLAVDTLFELIDAGTADNIRLGAAKEILDRAGIKGGVEVEVQVNHGINPSLIIQEKMKAIAENAIERNKNAQSEEEVLEQVEDIAEAEIAEDEES